MDIEKRADLHVLITHTHRIIYRKRKPSPTFMHPGEPVLEHRELVDLSELLEQSLRSFSSRFRGIWPMKSLMASWSFMGIALLSPFILAELFAVLKPFSAVTEAIFLPPARCVSGSLPSTPPPLSFFLFLSLYHCYTLLSWFSSSCVCSPQDSFTFSICLSPRVSAATLTRDVRSRLLKRPAAHLHNKSGPANHRAVWVKVLVGGGATRQTFVRRLKVCISKHGAIFIKVTCLWSCI